MKTLLLVNPETHVDCSVVYGVLLELTGVQTAKKISFLIKILFVRVIQQLKIQVYQHLQSLHLCSHLLHSQGIEYIVKLDKCRFIKPNKILNVCFYIKPIRSMS